MTSPHVDPDGHDASLLHSQYSTHNSMQMASGSVRHAEPQGFQVPPALEQLACVSPVSFRLKPSCIGAVKVPRDSRALDSFRSRNIPRAISARKTNTNNNTDNPRTIKTLFHFIFIARRVHESSAGVCTLPARRLRYIRGSSAESWGTFSEATLQTTRPSWHLRHHRHAM